MERVKLYSGGEAAGEVTLRPEAVRTEVQASMEDPGDGLYRAVLVGERGELLLGVMEPAGRRLTICRRLYSRDVAGLGRLLRGEARCSFRFQERSVWQETASPAQLFRDPSLQSRLRPVKLAWWRREEDRLVLALPLEPGRPFPLEMLFCLAQTRRVEGRPCVVYSFDREERPLLP